MIPVPGSSNPKPVCRDCAADPTASIDELGSWRLEASSMRETDAQEYRCAACGEELSDRTITLADGSTKLHSSCFICCVDGAPIVNGYVEHKGEIFCEEHYAEYFYEPCGGCGQRIVCFNQESIQAMGQSWHVECFVCAYCSKPLSDVSDGNDSEETTPFNFYVFNGAIYCAKDYLEHMADKCSGCGFHVDAALEVLGHTWHPECFVCSECKEPLIHMSDPTFYVYNGQPLCARDREALMVLEEEERALLRSAPMPPVSHFAPYRAPHSSERGACISRGIWKALEGAARSSTLTSSAPSANSFSDAAFKAHLQLDFPSSDECDHPFNFEVFAPEVFQDLRKKAFGVAEEEYRCSLALRPLTGGDIGEGKSGNLFYFSWDQRYIVKTVDIEEAPFFFKCLKGYHRHMITEGRPCKNATSTQSLLPRYLGFYTLKMPQEPAMRLVVIANVFPPQLELKEKYDLKGVLGSKRYVAEDQQSEGAVLKDRNFEKNGRILNIGVEKKEQLMKQLRRDLKFLEDHHRIDYSLLVGVASVHAVKQEPQQWPTLDCHGLLSCNAKFPSITSSLPLCKGSSSGSVEPAIRQNGSGGFKTSTGSAGSGYPPTARGLSPKARRPASPLPPPAPQPIPVDLAVPLDRLSSLRPASVSSLRCFSPRPSENSPYSRKDSPYGSQSSMGYSALHVHATTSPRPSGTVTASNRGQLTPLASPREKFHSAPAVGSGSGFFPATTASPRASPRTSDAEGVQRTVSKQRLFPPPRSSSDSGGNATASSEDGEVYFMGLIDILEEYTMKKAIEGAVKTIKFQATHMTKKQTMADTSNAVSACSASHYATRLLDFLESKME